MWPGETAIVAAAAAVAPASATTATPAANFSLLIEFLLWSRPELVRLCRTLPSRSRSRTRFYKRLTAPERTPNRRYSSRRRTAGRTFRADGVVALELRECRVHPAGATHSGTSRRRALAGGVCA